MEEFFETSLVELKTLVLSKYPIDLEINLDKGMVSVNKDLPYCLVISEEEGEKIGIVFDKDPSVKELIGEKSQYDELCKPIGLVGENYIIYPEREMFKTVPLTGEMSWQINRQEIEKWSETIMPLLEKWGLVAYKLAPFLLIPIAMVALMAVNLWYGLVLKIASNLFQIEKINFGQSYKTSLLVYSGWNIFKWLVSMLMGQITEKVVNFSPFPFFETILITAIGLLMIKSEKTNFAKEKTEKKVV